ncbi:ribosomal protein S18 acetylase RimI-like enzyme [Wenzhouxiangella marina]|uniref:GCN5-like N-acetyltransferase n=1 Tax=Wenzhouxiangella marina TaxID=1579979 RepID=A0A0K0XTW0_9GAMM|nr:GCN5-like N-acetyltransferase [Wenzhouxiangella marina]MBB6088028.1 ribosomal protein S18 acetylase RimI-like enzyme [Wenzhouxiangella marina]
MSDADWRSRLEKASPSLDLPLVAEREGKPVGLAWGKVFPGEKDRAYLFQMWVAAEFRGQGIGRRLLQYVLSWAADLRVEWVELTVMIGNAPATRLYHDLGFRPEGDLEPLREGSDQRVQRLCLPLGNP